MTPKFNKYNNYKQSGIEWLGDIPIDWEVNRLRTWFVQRNTKVSDSDYQPLSVTKNGVMLQLESAAKSKDGDNRKLVKKGDFVVNSRSDRKGSSGVSNFDGSVSLIYSVLNPFNINSIYSNYLLRCYSFIEEFYRVGRGIVADLWTTRYEEMKNIKLAIPPLPEQEAIANFLDDKTNKIDKAIKQKEQLIQLLKERKQIIIQDAVTKGLNPDVKMKDSGVEWLGQIPKHWQVKRLGKFGKFLKGGGFSKSDLTIEGSKVILYGDIYTRYQYNIFKVERYVPPNITQNSVRIFKDDILFTGSGETIEDIGKSVNVKLDDELYAGGDVIIFRQNKNNSCFVNYFLNSEIVKHQKSLTGKGEIIVHTYSSKLKEIQVTVPPLPEQEEIVEHIEEQSAKIDKAINLQETQITKLKEYKSVLIDNAVTGKIKVV